MTLLQRFPSVSFMERAVRGRIPRFAADYMMGGIGPEVCLKRNRDAIDAVKLMPRYVRSVKPDHGQSLFGHRYDAPFAVAPIGMGGLIWPRAAEHLAASARDHNVPFVLSTFATTTLERIREVAGEHAWFQLYVPNRVEIETAIIDRAANAGYDVLVVTVDIPTHTTRERDVRNGLAVPPRFDLRTLADIVVRPVWAMNTLAAGIPRFENVMPYVDAGADMKQAAKFLSSLIEGHVHPDMLKRIRDRWKGTLVVKGILNVEDALDCRAMGVDGVIVSNHGGRQLDAAPASVEVLGAIKAAVGDDMAVLADGGVRSGLDVARMLARGADFVLMGRAFMFAMAAIGARGADHAMVLFKEELRSTMAQLGCPDIASLPDFTWSDAADAPPA